MVRLRVEVMLEVDSTWWKCWFKISENFESATFSLIEGWVELFTW